MRCTRNWPPGKQRHPSCGQSTSRGAIDTRMSVNWPTRYLPPAEVVRLPAARRSSDGVDVPRHPRRRVPRAVRADLLHEVLRLSRHARCLGVRRTRLKRTAKSASPKTKNPPSRRVFRVFRNARRCGILSWCPGEDSNLHAFRHMHLKHTCLPITPPGHFFKLLLLP